MKYMLSVAAFVIFPYFLLATFVMPALRSLKNIYGNADTIAQQSAVSTPAHHQPR